MAADARGDPWQFAVRIAELRLQGVQESELRWLAAKDYAHHAYETTVADAAERTFRRATVAQVDESSAFVFTESGAQFAREHLASIPHEPVAPSKPRAKPKWDSVRREFRVGRTIVKRYRVRGPDQHLILAAFEDEGWPERIDDPLPRGGKNSPQRKLQYTINSLNRNQRPHLIRFSGDGSGQGVLWRYIDDG